MTYYSYVYLKHQIEVSGQRHSTIALPPRLAPLVFNERMDGRTDGHIADFDRPMMAGCSNLESGNKRKINITF
jgi:hypothetical protein